MMSYSDMWQEIEASGYANGEEFESEDRVREYFTVKNFKQMFGGECDESQATLNTWADAVIREKRHCAF
jgi:hypothetical protein